MPTAARSDPAGPGRPRRTRADCHRYRPAAAPGGAPPDQLAARRDPGRPGRPGQHPRDHPLTLVGDWRRKGLQMVVIGLGAAAIGFLIGRLFHAAG